MGCREESRERDPREPREEVMEMREAKVRGTEAGSWQREGKGQVPGTQHLRERQGVSGWQETRRKGVSDGREV